MKHLLFLNKFFVKYKWRVIPGVFFVVVSNLFAVVPAQVIGHAFDLITENITIYRLYNGFERQTIVYDIFGYNLFIFGALILALYLLRGLFLFFMRQTIILMSRHIEYDIKNEIYAHYQKLSLGFSPCPNDTFIFDALIHHKIDTEGLQFEVFFDDVETLNKKVFSVSPVFVERLEMSKVSPI